MPKCLLIASLILNFSFAFAVEESPELKKSYLEDIFIWKISDELKLTAKEERQFTEISRSLNKQKSELNRKIQESILQMKDVPSEAQLRAHRKLIQSYNQISIAEFDAIKNLLGSKKFGSYLKIKNELTTKVKSMLIGVDKKERPPRLPSPKVIVEGQ